MTVIPALPFTIVNGVNNDATQVMGNFNFIRNSVNALSSTLNAIGIAENSGTSAFSIDIPAGAVPIVGTIENTEGSTVLDTLIIRDIPDYSGTAAEMTALQIIEHQESSPLSTIYDNGALGVGATLTHTVNGAYSGTLNDSIIVIGQTDPAENGIYTLTTEGDGSNPWVFTRRTDFDTSSEMTLGSYVTFANPISTFYVFNGSGITVGTDPIEFVVAENDFTIINSFSPTEAQGQRSLGAFNNALDINLVNTIYVIAASTGTAIPSFNGANIRVRLAYINLTG